MANDDPSVPLVAPTSPLGIPSWLWLTLLTFFMLFIIWLSLRNLSHLLPLRVQHAIQDLSERLGVARHIRLLEQNEHLGATSGNRHMAASFAMDLDEGSSDDDDDELPLATRFNQHDSTFRKAGTQQKLDRIVRLFSGGIQHARGYGHIPGEPAHEDEERVLDLPSLPSPSHYGKRHNPAASSPSPKTLFQTDPHDGDASPLPAQVSLPNARYSNTGPLSPSLDRSYPRSPIRSPALSRTPSLVAIAEESSVSPRSSFDVQRPNQFDSPGPELSAELRRSASGSSQSQTLPDWATARSRSP